MGAGRLFAGRQGKMTLFRPSIRAMASPGGAVDKQVIEQSIVRDSRTVAPVHGTDSQGTVARGKSSWKFQHARVAEKRRERQQRSNELGADECSASL